MITTNLVYLDTKSNVPREKILFRKFTGKKKEKKDKLRKIQLLAEEL